MPLEDAAALDAEAARLDERAAALREERRDVVARAAALRRQARQLRAAANKPAPAARGPGRPTDSATEHDTELLEGIYELLGRAGQPLGAGEIAARLGIPKARGRVALVRLVTIGMIEQIGHDDRYRVLVADAPAPRRRNEQPSWEQVVRDAARELGTFTIADMCSKLPDLAEHVVRRCVKGLIAKDALTVERRGRQLVLTYRKPTGKNGARPKQPTPESMVTAPPARGGRDLRSGRRMVTANKDLRAILRDAERAGAKVERTGGDHLRITLPNGKTLTKGSTPGDAPVRLLRHDLRKAGLDV